MYTGDLFSLYLKRSRPPPSNPTELPRTSSRTNLFSRGNSIGRVRVSSRAVPLAKPSDSPYYIGLERVKTDPYDRIKNTDGIIQLGLAESTLCFDLLQRWMSENLMESMMQSDDGKFDISSIAMYKPIEGLLELRGVDNNHSLFFNFLNMKSFLQLLVKN
ncbi:unnamed protein product [Arabidopsis lyrata]|nr:unnamed protein product [Arabidopsis lyrata]